MRHAHAWRVMLLVVALAASTTLLQPAQAKHQKTLATSTVIHRLESILADPSHGKSTSFGDRNRQTPMPYLRKHVAKVPFPNKSLFARTSIKMPLLRSLRRRAKSSRKILPVIHRLTTQYRFVVGGSTKKPKNRSGISRRIAKVLRRHGKRLSSVLRRSNERRRRTLPDSFVGDLEAVLDKFEHLTSEVPRHVRAAWRKADAADALEKYNERKERRQAAKFRRLVRRIKSLKRRLRASANQIKRNKRSAQDRRSLIRRLRKILRNVRLIRQQQVRSSALRRIVLRKLVRRLRAQRKKWRRTALARQKMLRKYFARLRESRKNIRRRLRKWRKALIGKRKRSYKEQIRKKNLRGIARNRISKGRPATISGLRLKKSKKVSAAKARGGLRKLLSGLINRVKRKRRGAFQNKSFRGRLAKIRAKTGKLRKAGKHAALGFQRVLGKLKSRVKSGIQRPGFLKSALRWWRKKKQ